MAVGVEGGRVRRARGRPVGERARRILIVKLSNALDPSTQDSLGFIKLRLLSSTLPPPEEFGLKTADLDLLLRRGLETVSYRFRRYLLRESTTLGSVFSAFQL